MQREESAVEMQLQDHLDETEVILRAGAAGPPASSFSSRPKPRGSSFGEPDSAATAAAPSLAIDVARERYPFCIVWTPIPVLTWLLPFVGHMGVATSRGIINDFAGPYTISVDNFSFGRTTRYIQVVDKNLAGNAEFVRAWDAAVAGASQVSLL